MTNWKDRQKNCKRCSGMGYVQSEMKHASGRGKAWAAKCECQPRTMDELKEAVEQERATAEREPAEVFCLAEFLAEEMEARCWTASDVASRMSDKRSHFQNGMLVNMVLAIQDDRLLKDDHLLEELARAFDVDDDFFKNLDEAWRAWPDKRRPFHCPEHLFMPFVYTEKKKSPRSE